MSVVGIDFGNLNTCVAVARNKGIDVITNEVSNRATPSLVSFGEKQRFLGEAAKTQEVSNFKNTASSLKRLLGLAFSDPDVQKFEVPHVNCALVKGKKDQVSASVQFRDNQQEFGFTEVAAMFLTKVKEFTALEIKMPVTDCVISVPQWFTDHQRRAVFDAAEIAQLNCLRVLTDTTAIALGYGITKVDLPDVVADPTLKPKNVCFVDLGHSSYQVSIVTFVKGKLTVRGTACDRHLGGRDFDQVLTDHYITEFSAKYKIDIASNKKAIFRLRQGCERAKKILSANLIAMINVECLMEEKDVSAQVNRADYEAMIAPLISKLDGPLHEALQAAGLTPEDIDSVEITGGSTRIPLVKEKLVSIFGDNKLQTTLNQDEAVARGCALQCAVLSPVLKVRDFTVNDWNGFPVQFSWDASKIALTKEGLVDDNFVEAFPFGNVVPSSKILSLARIMDADELAANKGSVDLIVSADYTEDIFKRGASIGNGRHIGSWTIKGIKHHAPLVGDILVSPAQQTKASIRIRTRLDGNNIVQVESAQLLVEVTVAATEDKKTKKDDASTPTTPLTPEISAESVEPLVKKINRKYELAVEANIINANKADLLASQNAEVEMNATDRLVIDTADRRNALEEYVYETRSKLEMAWSDFCDDASRTKFMKALGDMEDWLYSEEGETATKSMFVEKAEFLRKIGDPIAFRAREFDSRTYSEKAFKDYANSIIIGITSGDDKYAHIPQLDLEKCTNECIAKLDWLNSSIAKQNDVAKCAPLVITSDEINRAKSALQAFVTPTLSIPKPKPVVVEPVVAAEEKKDDVEMAEPLEEVKEATPASMDMD